MQDDHSTRWSVAQRGNEPGTHVHGHWHVTNSSDNNVVLLKARLTRYDTSFAHVFTRNAERNVFGRNAIYAHRMTEVVADFSFFPPIGRNRQTLVSDVIFTDNFGDEHRVRSVQFRYIGPDRAS